MHGIVEGCGTRARVSDDGSYVLVPFELPCELFARHAPGTASRTPAKNVEDAGGNDVLIDFVVDVPSEADTGVMLERREDGGVYVSRATFEVSQWEQLHLGSQLLAVGDTAAHELTDAELSDALVYLAEPIHIRQFF